MIGWTSFIGSRDMVDGAIERADYHIWPTIIEDSPACIQRIVLHFQALGPRGRCRWSCGVLQRFDLNGLLCSPKERGTNRRSAQDLRLATEMVVEQTLEDRLAFETRDEAKTVIW